MVKILRQFKIEGYYNNYIHDNEKRVTIQLI